MTKAFDYENTGFTCGAGNANSNTVTMFMDTGAIEAWGVDDDGCLWVKAPKAAFKEIASCAESLAD